MMRTHWSTWCWLYLASNSIRLSISLLSNCARRVTNKQMSTCLKVKYSKYLQLDFEIVNLSRTMMTSSRKVNILATTSLTLKQLRERSRCKAVTATKVMRGKLELTAWVRYTSHQFLKDALKRVWIPTVNPWMICTCTLLRLSTTKTSILFLL